MELDILHTLQPRNQKPETRNLNSNSQTLHQAKVVSEGVGCLPAEWRAHYSRPSVCDVCHQLHFSHAVHSLADMCYLDVQMI